MPRVAAASIDVGLSEIRLSADDIYIGEFDAPGTIVEYLSPTSVHCARWHRDVFPQVKSELIDTGRARFVIRELATPPLDIAYPTFLLARQAGRERYLSFIEAVFAAQEAVKWDARKKPDLRRISEAFGMSGSEFDACIGNWDAISEAVRRTSIADLAFGIEGAPTFVVGETRFDGKTPFAVIKAALSSAGGR